jgi:hypothetical protein
MAGSFDAVVECKELTALNTHAMQVPQVTEEAALAVVEIYPTLITLARAYSKLVSPLFFSILISFTYYNTCL